MLLYAGTQEQCVQVIVHLERIIHFRAHLLIKENHRRRIPKYGIKPSSNSFSISLLYSLTNLLMAKIKEKNKLKIFLDMWMLQCICYWIRIIQLSEKSTSLQDILQYTSSAVLVNSLLSNLLFCLMIILFHFCFGYSIIHY